MLNEVETIDDGFMYNCNKITQIQLPPSVKRIGDYFMNNCRELNNITIPSSIEYIGNHFMNMTNLETIDLSNLRDLTNINDRFMNNCQNLKNVYLPPNLRSIGNDFLTNCINIESIVLPADLSSIGNSFMNNCKKLKNISSTNVKKLSTVGDNFLSGISQQITITYSDFGVYLKFEFRDPYKKHRYIQERITRPSRWV